MLSIIYKIVSLLISIIYLILSIAFVTLLERKTLGSIQRRRGPTHIGIFGLLQPIADGLKLLLKEIVLVTHADHLIFFSAPIFSFFTALFL
jgi:NADH:ubiquinone oxidoreductase subunit H